MKKLKLLDIIVFLSIFVSCGTSKNVADRETTRSETNTVTQQRANELVRETGTSDEEIRRTEAKNNTMFDAVQMNSEQRNNYQRNWRETQKAHRSRNSNQDMNAYEKMEQEDKIMKKLLDESQYERYQLWRRENPIRDSRD